MTMKIVICASLDFTNEIKDASNQLKKKGFDVVIPKTSEMILNGGVTLERIKREKASGEISKRAIKQDVIRYYFGKIREADVILVLNFGNKGIKGYIGGSVFLEMGFAHVLGKKIFLLNEIPDMIYTSDIRSMQPVILNGNLNRIR